jgi:FkbM family methyltransferase
MRDLIFGFLDRNPRLANRVYTIYSSTVGQIVQLDPRTRLRCVAAEDRLRRSGGVVDLGGFRLKLDPATAHDVLLAAELFARGSFEGPTTKFLRQSLRQGETFVDVGASNGYFTCLASAIVGPTGRVLSLEPSTLTTRRLMENIRLNGCLNVTVMGVAAGSTRGSAPLFLPRVDDGLSSLYSRRGVSSIENVEVRTLDELIGSSSVNLLKVDVEGAELEVFDGASQTISSNKDIAIVFEYNRPRMYSLRASPVQLIEKLASLGLSTFVLTDSGGLAGPVREPEEIVGANPNLLAARPDTIGRFQTNGRF